jgi:hypothetical protein
MNTELRESIIRHILSGFAVIPSNFVNLSKTKSIKQKDFLLTETVAFTDEQGNVTDNKIWGCQSVVEGKEIKILLADCTQDSTLIEYALLISLKDAPTYGIYLVDDPQNCDSLIACSLDGKEWLECQTYLQATFLAGMEQMREAFISYSKCLNYKDQYKTLLSFIKFHNRVYEAKYL